MNDLLLQTHHLKKSYEDGRLVIDHVDLHLRTGEFLVIMGSSGSGKSTLLHLLGGLELPTGGSVQYGQARLHRQNEKERALFRRAHVGFVFQSFLLLPHLSLRDNLIVAGLLQNRHYREVRQAADQLLREVGIGALADRLPAQVSGGEQQRCAIARALINRPALLLADEPTGNLNSAASLRVLDLLSQFHRQGQTIVLVTHDLPTAACGDRIVFMQDGRLEDALLFNKKNKKISTEEKKTTIINWLAGKAW